MIEYLLKDKDGKPVTLGDFDKIHELDKLFLGEKVNQLEKENSRAFQVNGSYVYLFFRDRECSRANIPSHEEDTKREFENKSKYRLEELKCL